MRSEGYSTWVCVCVCLSVKSHLTSRMSNRAINERAYSVACERQKICGDLPKTTAFKSYAAKHEFTGLPAVSLFRSTHSEAPEVTQRVSTTFSLAQKQLARVGVRTDNTTRTHSHDARRGQFSAHAHWHSTQDAPRVCTSVLFLFIDPSMQISIDICSKFCIKSSFYFIL